MSSDSSPRLAALGAIVLSLAVSAGTASAAPLNAKEPLTLMQAARAHDPHFVETAAAQRRELASPVLRVCADPDNLPFSNRRGQGFENAIARLVAGELGKRVSYTWARDRRGFVRSTLGADRCDVITSVPVSYRLTATTRPYYRSSYVFVTRRARKLHITSFDDPRLERLTIGLPGAGDGLTPPAQALASRGLMGRTRIYSLLGGSRADAPRALIDAVARGDIDVAIAWGPLAGYFARREAVPLEVTPVMPPAHLRFLKMSYPIAMGVRHGDAALKAELDRALVREHLAIDRVLVRYGVPLLPLARAGAAQLPTASRNTG